MKKIKISAVSYLNTYPFLYGILQDKVLMSQIELTTDYPALCAEKLKNNIVDIGLVPIAILPQLADYQIISDYCIGAYQNVQSVMLFSNVQLKEISSIYLDYQSMTSVNLTKILAKFYWKIEPEWITGINGFEYQIKGNNAGVIIGDRALNLIKKYKFSYDLAKHWFEFTELPFVFAVWTTNKKLPSDFVNLFNKALENGINNIPKTLDYFRNSLSKINYDAYEYLNRNIDYHLDNQKVKAIETYLSYLSKI